MTRTIDNSLDENVWREFVCKHPQSTIYHTPEMFKVFKRTNGYKPTIWTVVDEHPTILALLLPVNISLMSGPFYHWTTRAVVNGSVICIPGEEGKESLKLLLNAYNREMHNRILFTEFRNSFDLSDIQPTLIECKYYFEDHLNYLIDLDQTEETLWRSISKSGRQSIRSSEHKGTIVEEISERTQIKIVYQLLQGVYSRIHVPLADISLFEAAYDILAPSHMLKVFFARVDDQFIGTTIILMHNRRIILWYLASDRGFSSYSSGELLMWRIIQWGKEHGFHEFDLGGGGKPNEEYGPRKFKAKFGGKSVYYGRNICIHSPFRLQFSKQIYSWIRKGSVLSLPAIKQHNDKKIVR